MTVVGSRGKVMSIAWSGVEDLRLRTRAVLERSKVHVVPGPGADGTQERAVHPGDERAVQFARSPEPRTVIRDRGHEDILHLQVAARMQQRSRIHEAFRGAARQMEADVTGRLGQQIVER